MIYGALIFPETLPPERRRAFDWRRANPLGAWKTMRALAGMDGVAGVLVLWQIASLVYPMTWSLYCIAQLGWTPGMIGASRSEEHTSELQSLMRISYAVSCLKTKNSINQKQ